MHPNHRGARRVPPLFIPTKIDDAQQGAPRATVTPGTNGAVNNMVLPHTSLTNLDASVYSRINMSRENVKK